MTEIQLIDDAYIDEIIKAAEAYNPALKKTQGIKLRELIKRLRDRMEQGDAEAVHVTGDQSIKGAKAFIQVSAEELSLIKNGYSSLLKNPANQTANYILTLPAKNGELAVKADLNKTAIGLGNVDNTSDANKPVSNVVQASLDMKQNKLGFSPENLANKAISLSNPDDTKYPTTKAVATAIAGISLTPGAKGDKGETGATGAAGSDATVLDATAASKGKIRLTGDLGGTADAPTVPGLSTKEPVFSKNTAFNKNFGATADTVAQGNDTRITNGQTAFDWGNYKQYGLGAALLATDYNTIPSYTFARNQGLNAGNAPTTGIHSVWTTGTDVNLSAVGLGAQLALGYSNGSGNFSQGELYLRSKSSATVWSDWKKVYHQGNFANGSESQYIRGDGSLAAFPAIPAGTVGSVTSANSYITIANNSTNPLVTLNAGSSPNQVVVRDGAGFISGHLIGNATTASNSLQWNGWTNLLPSGVYSTGLTIDGIVASTSGDRLARVDDLSVQKFVGLNTGTTFNNSISGRAANATLWGAGAGISYTGTELATPPYFITLNPGGLAGYSTIAQVRSTLGIAIGGETLKTVTDRGNNSTSGITVGDGTVKGVLSYGVSGAVVGSVSNHALNLYVASDTKARILPNGNFGLGTLEPIAKLDIANGSVNLTSGHDISWGTYAAGKPTMSASDVVGLIWYPSGNAGTNSMRLAPNGQLSTQGEIVSKRPAGVLTLSPGIDAVNNAIYSYNGAQNDYLNTILYSKSLTVYNPSTGLYADLQARAGAFTGDVTAPFFNGHLAGRVFNQSAYMRFNWSGQSGQPAWLWGGSNAEEMYVYDPSNFSVKTALSLRIKPHYSWSASFTPGQFDEGLTNSFVRAEEGWFSFGGLINFRPYSSSGGGSLQLYTPYGGGYGGDELKFRLGDYSAGGDVWSTWKTLVNKESLGTAAFLNATESRAAGNVVKWDGNARLHAQYYYDENSDVLGGEYPIVSLYGKISGQDIMYQHNPQSVRQFLGLDGLATAMVQRYGGFGVDANTVAEHTSAFTYALNAPYNGTLMHFGANGYGTQFNTQYGDGRRLAFRTHNGDAASWNTWKEIWHSDNLVPSVSASGGTVVLRDVNGYINNSYINTSDNVESAGLGYLMGKNSSDNYHRSFTAAAVSSWLGLSAKANVSGQVFTGEIKGPDGTDANSYVTKQQVPALASQGTGVVRLIEAAESGIFNVSGRGYLRIGSTSTDYLATIPAGTLTSRKGMIRIILGNITMTNSVAQSPGDVELHFFQGANSATIKLGSLTGWDQYTATSTAIVTSRGTSGLFFPSSSTQGRLVGGTKHGQPFNYNYTGWTDLIGIIDFRETVNMKVWVGGVPSNVNINILPLTIEVTSL